MLVNSFLKALFKNRVAMLGGIGLALVIVFFLLTSSAQRTNRDQLSTRVNLIIREMGHQLLLYAGDSVSRVMPVRETKEGVFLLAFENELIFQPDTLVVLTQRLLARTDLPSDYTVTVHECNKPEIVYGFQISPTKKDIKPCGGRTQPQNCYTIQVAFAEFHKSSFGYSSYSFVISAFLVLIVVVLLIERAHKRDAFSSNEVSKVPLHTNLLSDLPGIGNFKFDARHQHLIWNDQIMALTDKECKILALLNQNFNQLTTREDLTREIWTNEGIITGRSLDMFVSKLRKKLSADETLRITNIHGKGYKLEKIGSNEHQSKNKT